MGFVEPTVDFMDWFGCMKNGCLKCTGSKAKFLTYFEATLTEAKKN